MDTPPTVSLSITVKDGNAAIEFYKEALGAEVVLLMRDPGGGVAHSEMMIGTSKVYLSDESPEWHAKAMPEGMQAPCLFSVATEDCDAAFKRAVEAGGKPLRSRRTCSGACGSRWWKIPSATGGASHKWSRKSHPRSSSAARRSSSAGKIAVATVSIYREAVA